MAVRKSLRPQMTPQLGIFHTPSTCHSPQNHQGWGCFCVVGGVPTCLYTVPGNPDHQQGYRSGNEEGGSVGMDLGNGVSFGGRTTKAEADKGMEWGSGAQRGCVPCLKSHSTLGLHV